MIPIIRQVLRTGIVSEPTPEAREEWRVRSSQIQGDILRLLGRALVIRQVDAGSCNGCELEIHALNNPYYNIEGLGIRFAASPRHADMLLVTGPVSRNMERALRIAYEAMPDPKLVVAVGDCGRDGGLFGESYATCGGVDKVIPVDVAVPGCPPPPLDILTGILTAISRR
jgi:Ni,Fe-hydrogenase III small subunit